MHKLTEATIARTFRQSPLLVRALAFIHFAAHAVMRPQPPERSLETTAIGLSVNILNVNFYFLRGK